MFRHSTPLGCYALKSNLNNTFISAGIGSDSAVGAMSSRIGGSKSWETFDMDDLGNRYGLNMGRYVFCQTGFIAYLSHRGNAFKNALVASAQKSTP